MNCCTLNEALYSELLSGSKVQSRPQLELKYTIYREKCWKNVWLLLPLLEVSDFARIRLDQKWNIATISRLEIHHFHFPSFIEFENIYVGEKKKENKKLFSSLKPFIPLTQCRKPIKSLTLVP